MADEVTDKVVDKVEDTTVELTEEQKTEADRKQTIINIENLLKSKSSGAKTEVTDTEDKSTEVDKTQESDEAEGKSDEWEEVSPVVAEPFIKAASEAGWGDARIRQYAEEHSDEDLMILTNLLGGRSTTQEKPVVKDTKDELKLSEDDLAVLDRIEDNGVLKKHIQKLISDRDNLTSKVDKLTERFDEVQKAGKVDENLQRLQITNGMFDEAAKVMPSLGKTNSLPKYPDGSLVQTSAEFKARSQIFDVAVALSNAGKPWRQAVKDALQWYKGSGIETELEGNVLRKIKAGEKRLGAKRSDKQVEKTYASEREQKADVVNEALKKYNKELPVG